MPAPGLTIHQAGRYIPRVLQRLGQIGVGLWLAVFLHTAAASAQVYEGIGEIKAGNTVQARKEAVDLLMRSALRASLGQTLTPQIFQRFGSLLEDNLVVRAASFVRNYSVQAESAAGTNYRVVARVEVDTERLINELKQHAFITASIAPPKVILLLNQIPPSNNALFALTDELAPSLSALAMQVFSNKKVLAVRQQEPYVRHWQVYDSNPAQVSGNVVAALARSYQADYIVYGMMNANYTNGEITVVRAEDEKYVGRIQAATLLQKQRQDQLLYQLTGLIMTDWLERWQIEQRLILKIQGLDDLRQYANLVKHLQGIAGVDSVKEESFLPKSVVFRLGVQNSGRDVAMRIMQDAYFKKRFRFQLKDERTLEALVQ